MEHKRTNKKKKNGIKYAKYSPTSQVSHELYAKPIRVVNMVYIMINDASNGNWFAISSMSSFDDSNINCSFTSCSNLIASICNS